MKRGNVANRLCEREGAGLTRKGEKGRRGIERMGHNWIPRMGWVLIKINGGGGGYGIALSMGCYCTFRWRRVR